MATYDIESFFNDLETFLVANLNTKLAALDTEKNDGISLTTLASNAYFFSSMGEEVANMNPFVYYDIDSMKETGSVYAATTKGFIANVIVVLSDEGNDPDIAKKLLRYQRALIELFESNFSNVCPVARIQVSGLQPISFQLRNRPCMDRAIGVSLEVTIA